MATVSAGTFAAMSAVLRWFALLGVSAVARAALTPVERMVATILRVTGVAKVLHVIGYIAFDLPRITTAVGLIALAGTVAIRLYLLVAGFDVPAYIEAYWALLVAVSLVASAMLVAGRWRAITRAGWMFGSTVSAASIAMYLTSHSGGLPGLPLLVGRWNYPLATFAVILAGTFLATHASVLVGVNVAYPDRRHWYA